MKYLYLLILTVFIASCGAKVDETKVVEDENAIEISNQINAELETLVEDAANTSKVTRLDAKYTNPAWEVDMVIDYTLDSEWKIETIDVSATTYDLKDFNTAAQVLIGKTLEEAKTADIAGGSLTNEAFKKALK